MFFYLKKLIFIGNVDILQFWEDWQNCQMGPKQNEMDTNGSMKEIKPLCL